eukprot:GHVP01010572.1.p1 GENE.GHVP01010572.1~~GHVP01010572.1.p1  ORF type:complete len:212 (+),score=17.39 GHVP01010572.1:136-771(+)
MLFVFWAIQILLMILAIRALWVLQGRICSRARILKKNRRSRIIGSKRRVFAVYGSGGHTSEMISLTRKLDNKSVEVFSIVGEGDEFSKKAISDSVLNSPVFTIKRPREVHQPLYLCVLPTIKSILQSFLIFGYRPPDLILLNGPGIAVAVAVAAVMQEILFFRTTAIIFIESICRVNRLSLTGRILSVFVDEIVVQWPELQTNNRKYFGIL